MVCATARRAPISAYFEFDAQPDHRMVYTVMLEIAIRNSSPRFMFAAGLGIGRGIQARRARISAKVGVIVNMMGEEADGRIGSLMNSLMPSAIGCRSP